MQRTDEEGVWRRNCNVRISARVKRATVHVQKLLHINGVYLDKVQDCAGKSIFSANHILITAYGQIVLLLASINLICQVLAAHIRGENSFGTCATVSQRMLFGC